MGLYFCELCEITRLGPLSLSNYVLLRLAKLKFSNKLGHVLVANASLSQPLPQSLGKEGLVGMACGNC